MACTALKADGTPCGAAASGELCFVHRPGARAQLHEARSRGGKNRHTGDNGVLNASLESTESVRSIVRNTVRRLRRKENSMEPDRANAIFRGCMVALKALDMDGLGKRVDELERRTATLAHLTAAQLLEIVEKGKANGVAAAASGH